MRVFLESARSNPYVQYFSFLTAYHWQMAGIFREGHHLSAMARIPSCRASSAKAAGRSVMPGGVSGAHSELALGGLRHIQEVIGPGPPMRRVDITILGLLICVAAAILVGSIMVGDELATHAQKVGEFFASADDGAKGVSGVLPRRAAELAGNLDATRKSAQRISLSRRCESGSPGCPLHRGRRSCRLHAPG